jgi:hypothetical protein
MRDQLSTTFLALPPNVEICQVRLAGNFAPFHQAGAATANKVKDARSRMACTIQTHSEQLFTEIRIFVLVVSSS